MNENPGVGNYDLEDHTIKSWLRNKKISQPVASQVKVSSDDNDVPGPGAYQPEIRSSKRQAPGYTIGTGKRPKLALFDPSVPGPGKYLAVYN